MGDPFARSRRAYQLLDLGCPRGSYFAQPYALHGAYWHEKFGTPMSAGCPNLAPADAVWLLDFTDPPLPDGWQAIGPARGQNGTMVVVGP